MARTVPFGDGIKSAIFSSFKLLDPVVTGLSKIQSDKPLSLDVGVEESGYTIATEGEKAQIVFSYGIDNDGDSGNGRLVLKDTFEVDLKKKTLVSFQRKVEANQSTDFWTRSVAALNALRAPNENNAAVQRFFKDVVLKLDLPPPEKASEARAPEVESPAPPKGFDPVNRLPKILNYSWMAPLHRVVALSHHYRASAPRSVLTRYEKKSPGHLNADQIAIDAQNDNFIAAAHSPEMLGGLFVGSSAFTLGRSLASTFAFRSLGTARFVSTAVGLLFEAPAFELTSRKIRAVREGESDQSDFGTSVLRNYLTFGAFRGVASVSRSPLASFAALHGMNELERFYGLQASGSSYMQRVMGDGLLFAQLGMTTQLSEATLGRALGVPMIQHEGLQDLKMKSLRYAIETRNNAEMFVQRGEVKNGIDRYYFTGGLGEHFFLDPNKTSWILGLSDPAQGFMPDLPSLDPNSPSVYVFKGENGKYYVQRYLDAPGKEALKLEYFDPASDQWLSIGKDPIPVDSSKDLEIKAGDNNLFKLQLKKNVQASSAKEKDVTPSPDPVAVSIPVVFLEDLHPDHVVLANAEQTLGAAPRELKVSYFVPGYGEVSAYTAVGIDKKVLDGSRKQAVNEDAFAVFRDTQGRLVLFVADGMGGHGAGDFASAGAVNKIAEVLRDGSSPDLGDAAMKAHHQILLDAHGGSTVIGGVRINPDGTVAHVSAGDIRFWVLRRMPDGSRQLIEPHAPDTLAFMLWKKGITFGSGKPITNELEANASSTSNRVLSGLGIIDQDTGNPVHPKLVDEFNLGQHGQLLHQEVLKINVGTDSAPQWENLVLQEGDELVLMSDGPGDLVNKEQFLGVIQDTPHASNALDAIELYTKRALELYNWRYTHAADKADFVQIPSGQLYEGLFINKDGDIHNQPQGGNLVAHVGPDNVTALVYRHNPNKLGVGPLLPQSGLPPATPGTGTDSNTTPSPADPQSSGGTSASTGTAPNPVTPPPAAVLSPQGTALPIEAPVIKIFYEGKFHDFSSPDSMTLNFGRSHQAHLFTDQKPWIANDYFKIEYVKENGVWMYKLTALAGEGLWVDNQKSDKNKVSKILGAGEEILLPSGDYSLTPKKSPTEFDKLFMMILPPIKEKPATP